MKDFRLALIGACQLKGPDGQDIRLGKKAQALLAILAYYKDSPVTRAKLQDLLWSLSSPQHGRDSLKKALQQLRRKLNDEDAEILFCSGERVWLNRSCIQIDMDGPEGAKAVCDREFLEGLDVRDPNFEDWLRDVRSQLTDQRSRQQLSPQVNFTKSATMQAPHHNLVRLRIEPVQNSPSDLIADTISNLFLDRLGVVLTQSGLVDIVDNRMETAILTKGDDLTLCCRAISVAGQTIMQLVLRRNHDNAVLWGNQRSIEASGVVGAEMRSTVIETADQVLCVVAGPRLFEDEEKKLATRHAMEGIENTFRLSPENLANAASSFKKAIEIEPRGTFHAWLAFLSTFRHEQTKGAGIRELRESTEVLMQRALEVDRFNPVSRSLLTHVCSFLYRDFERANEMITPMRGNEPDSPMYFFSLSMLRFYEGQLGEAQIAAQKANLMGKYNPFSYAFSTSLCMIDLTLGNSESAVVHGRQALRRLPGGGQAYEPTLRYLTAAYATAGDVQNARATWSRLIQSHPENSSDKLREAHFPVPAEHARETLRESYAAIGTIIH